MDKPVIIIGAKQLGKSVLEIFNSNQVVVYGFLDDDKTLHHSEINDISVLGPTNNEEFLKIIGKKCGVFVSTDDIAERKSLVKMLKSDYSEMPVNAIHKSAVIAESAYIGHGNFINAGVIVGSNSKVSNHCLLHAGAIVDSGASLGDYSQVGAGAVINSQAEIEEEVFIGSGVTIVSGIKIAKGARIGAGSVVINDVKSHKTVFGNPAKIVE